MQKLFGRMLSQTPSHAESHLNVQAADLHPMLDKSRRNFGEYAI